MRSDIIVMFNEEQKTEYIANMGEYRDDIRNYFKRIAHKESEFNKDISDMNEQELVETLMSLGIRREETRRHMLSFLRGYINWARLFGKTDNDSAINRITAESLGNKNAVREQMIASPEHLNYILDNAALKNEEGLYLMPNRTVRDQLVVWLLYSGMELSELPTLEKTDINIHEKKVITKEGEKYSVNHKIISLWKECATSTYLERKNGKAMGKGSIVGDIIKSDLMESNYLFRPILGKKINESETCKIGAFATIIKKIQKSYNNNIDEPIRITSENIKNSGIFNKLYKKEKKTGEISAEMIADYFKIRYTTKEELLIKTRNWRTDYNDWKLAFGYMNQIS